MSSSDIRQVVLYTADAWEHVCPTLRVMTPVEKAGAKLIRGNEWKERNLEVNLELIAEADVVVVQRDFPRHEEAYANVMQTAKTHKKAVIYDLDDLLFELPNSHPDVDIYNSTRFPVLKAVLEADTVTTASQYLRDYLRKFNPNTHLLPNYLDEDIWTIRTPAEVRDSDDQDPVVIGYMGGHSHLPDLEFLSPVFTRLIDQFGDRILFRFWGVAPPAEIVKDGRVEVDIPGLVNYADFAAYFSLQNCNIFLAPLIDSFFNRCKSSIKFLEYSALGVPGVYSRLDPYSSIVNHGENGFLATEEDEWVDLISLLVQDPSRRAKLAQGAHNTLIKKWLLSGHENKWIELYRESQSRSDQKRSFRGGIAVIEKVRQWTDDLEDDLEALEKKSYEAEEEIYRFKETQSKLEASLAEKEERIAYLDKRIEEVELTSENYRQDLERSTARIEDLETHIDDVEQDLRRVSSNLNDITNSTGWQFLQWLYRLRVRLIPFGSLRERFMHTAIKGTHYLLNYGARRMLKRLAERIFQRRKEPSQEIAELHVGQSVISMDFIVESGVICESPAISVIVLADEYEHSFIDAVEVWSNQQTYSGTEVVVFSQASGNAWINGDEENRWEASSFEEFFEGVKGKYICVASEDLLQQNAVYFETNLICLESESLAFTVNLLDHNRDRLSLINKGYLPGGEKHFLPGMVIRKDHIGDMFFPDLHKTLKEGGLQIVGRVISLTTDKDDHESHIQFNTHLPSLEMRLSGDYILAQESGDADYGKVHHITHAVDEVVPAFIIPSELPTVLVIMPFLAVGGAERLLLHLMEQLQSKIRFIVLAVEPFDTSLGTTADEFRLITPYVYTAMDFSENHLLFSLFSYLIQRFSPTSLYIANGAMWVYDALSTIKVEFPNLRIIDQVYHHHLGWIARYDPAVVASLDAHIGGNSKICHAYIQKGAKTAQVHLIDHGIKADEVDPSAYPDEEIAKLKDEFGLPSEKTVISFVARMHPQKRPIDFVELARRYKDDPQLIFFMVGDGPLAETVENEISRAKLENIIRRSFYQPISDVYAVSDVIVLPSEYEATPLVLLESQAMGKSVVVTDVGNNVEILEMTEGGQVVSRIGDISALQSALVRALEQDINPVKMRRAILNRYGMSVVAEKYRRVILGNKNA